MSEDQSAEFDRAVAGRMGDLQFFAEPGVDRLVAVVLNMAAELWAHQHRLSQLDIGDSDEADDAVALKNFIDRIFLPLREN